MFFAFCSNSFEIFTTLSSNTILFQQKAFRNKKTNHVYSKERIILYNIVYGSFVGRKTRRIFNRGRERYAKLAVNQTLSGRRRHYQNECSSLVWVISIFDTELLSRSADINIQIRVQQPLAPRPCGRHAFIWLTLSCLF